MFFQKVKSSDLIGRLNTEAYSPGHVLASQLMINSALNILPLGDIVSKKINNSIRNVKGELNIKGATIPMFRPADISCGVADSESAPKLTKEFESVHSKARVKAGDIVLGIAGSVGVAGRVPSNVEYGNINGSSARIATNKDFISAFLLAYLQSKYGQSSLLRYSVGSVQKHLNLEDLPAVNVVMPENSATQYIGNKVRQAETLREWSKNLEDYVRHYHIALIPTQTTLQFDRKTRSVFAAKMTDRLDAHFYPAVVEDYLEINGVDFEILNRLCLTVFNGQTQPEISEEVCEQITVTNLSSSFLKGEPRWVKKPASNDKYLKPHDLLICNAAHNKSYIGREITYVHSEKPLLPSTEVMVIRINRDLVPASYILSYLLTKLGFVQLQSTIRGITAHSYPRDVKQLEIPIPKIPKEKKKLWFACDDLMAKAGLATEISGVLTNAAKQLVEALIENKLTEQELISAQQALERGDNTLDRQILSRSTTKGIGDEDGAPLFPDLDQLYDLLNQAEKSQEVIP